MGKLIVDRENNYLGAAAKYNIFLDNQKIASVNNGNVLEFVIPNGHHTLYVKNGLISFGTKSNVIEFDIDDTADIRVMIKSVMTSLSGIKLEFYVVGHKGETGQSGNNKYIALEKLNTLKESGALSEEEFQKEKERILNGE
jgi:hypothetical protein